MTLVFTLVLNGRLLFGNGMFRVSQCPNPKDLEDLFRYEVLKMLKAEGKINEAVIANML